MLPLLLATALASPIPVTLEQGESGWTLLRGGQPFALQGVGGHEHLDLLVDIGGTAIRTWGVDDHTAALLDEAHARGLAVSVGLWLGHERHGFDYRDPNQLADQRRAVREAVLTLRDHPAVLMWGVGNEMEGFDNGDDDVIWDEVCRLAELVSELDPNHPVFTTTADIGGGRVAGVGRCDALDLHGVNSYGGAASLPERYRAAGGTKPLVLTEYGPPGTWETGSTAYGAPIEQSSTSKADAYRHVASETVHDPLVVGAFAFLWGNKTEATATWFGLLLPDGTRLGGVDALADVWGRPRDNRAPTAAALAVDGGDTRQPGESITVRWSVTDPDGDPLAVTWTLRPELTAILTGGDTLPTPAAVPGVVVSSSDQQARLQLPTAQGVYRVYAVARDDHGGGAVATLPLLVGRKPAPGAPLPIPWAVYQDAGVGGPWVPSGWMGDTDAITLQHDATEGCASPPTCLRLTVEPGGWTGVAWQHPANNWGQEDGGLDLSEARFLTFRVRGTRPSTRLTVGVGLIEDDQPFPDSLRRERTVDVGFDWQTVVLPLRGDRSSISTGLWWVLGPQGEPATLLFDDIQFVARRPR